MIYVGADESVNVCEKQVTMIAVRKDVYDQR